MTKFRIEIVKESSRLSLQECVASLFNFCHRNETQPTFFTLVMNMKFESGREKTRTQKYYKLSLPQK